jgi:hypothetical protein
LDKFVIGQAAVDEGLEHVVPWLGVGAESLIDASFGEAV